MLIDVIMRIVGVLLIISASWSPVQCECGEEDWQTVLKFCEKTLTKELHRIRVENLNASERLNITCSEHLEVLDSKLNKRMFRSWETTKNCLGSLKEECANMSYVQFTLNRRLHKYQVYEVMCNSTDFQESNEVTDCYRELIPHTNWCISMFDAQFSDLILDRKFPKACKLVHILLTCFHGIRGRISEDCGNLAEGDYTDNYMWPVLHKIQGTVTEHCDIGSENQQYFHADNDTNGQDIKQSFTAVVMLLITLGAILVELK